MGLIWPPKSVQAREHPSGMRASMRHSFCFALRTTRSPPRGVADVVFSDAWAGGASVKGIDGARSGSVASSAVADAFARRREAGLALVECAEAVNATAADMAARLGGGGKLIAFGNGAGSTDAQHIAVEWIHPLIVGTRVCSSTPRSPSAPSMSRRDDRNGAVGVDEIVLG